MNRKRPQPDLPQIVADPDRVPTPELQELETDLEAATTEFGDRAERLLNRTIFDRDGAEAALDVIDGWLGRIADIEENPALAGLSDVELFARTADQKQRRVPSVAVVRHWMIRGDNFERLMDYRETLDRDRFDLPDRDQA